MTKRILGAAIGSGLLSQLRRCRQKSWVLYTLQQTNTLAKSFLENFLKPANDAGVKVKYIGGQRGCSAA